MRSSRVLRQFIDLPQSVNSVTLFLARATKYMPNYADFSTADRHAAHLLHICPSVENIFLMHFPFLFLSVLQELPQLIWPTRPAYAYEARNASLTEAARIHGTS